MQVNTLLGENMSEEYKTILPNASIFTFMQMRKFSPGMLFINFIIHVMFINVRFKLLLISDPIYIDFGRLPAWNCPVENNVGGGQDDFRDMAPVIQRQKEIDQSLNNLDDLDSEPSINLRRKYKGKYQF